MKKRIVFVYATAMALLGTSFQACSSDDDVESAPIVTGEVVKTRLALSIPLGAPAGARTRMSADATQADGATFNGMSFVAYPLSAASAGTDDGEFRVASGTQMIGSTVTGTILKAGLSTKANDYWVDADIPVGVNSILFYGKSTALSSTTVPTEFMNGKLNTNALSGELSSPGDVSFNLQPIAAGLNVNNTDDVRWNAGNAVLALVNGVLQTKDASGKSWGSVVDSDPQGPILKSAHDALTGDATGSTPGLTTSSSESIRLMLEDLYNTMDAISSVNAMAQAIKAAITASYGTVQLQASSLAPYTLSWVEDASHADPQFPTTLRIPDGAIALRYVAADTQTPEHFEFSTTASDGMGVNAPASYVYPAQLFYYANSPIRVSNSRHQGDVPTGTDANENWATFVDNATYYPSRVVTATTQSVAVKDQIQYGVGNLKTRIQLSAATLTDSKDNSIDVETIPFTWTGVLVGGQKDVDWQFVPIKATTEYTIYDRDQEGTASVTTTLSATPNYTLVLQTEPGTTENPNTVTIAMEFKNTTTHDFNGANGQLIPAGGTFYLLARLDPTATSGVDKPDGDTTLGNRVFMQDYTTEVELTITSLKNAYNVVPDLRTPHLELGMSVNLKWQTGIKFETQLGAD